MSLANGRPYLAIPGPSVVPDIVLNAMHRAAPNIYEGELIDMMGGIVTDLRRVARTQHNVAIYISNGHGAWEAALSNCLAPGDRVLSLLTGRFGHGWAEMATKIGLEVEMLDFGIKTPIDAAQVEAALRADTEHRIKAVLTTHVDTSSGLRSDMKAIRDAITLNQPDKTEIMDILDRLFSIVYPGFFRDKTHKIYNIEHSVSTMIEDVMFHLNKQICVVLKYTKEFGDNEEEK